MTVTVMGGVIATVRYTLRIAAAIQGDLGSCGAGVSLLPHAGWARARVRGAFRVFGICAVVLRALTVFTS